MSDRRVSGQRRGRAPGTRNTGRFRMSPSGGSVSVGSSWGSRSHSADPSLAACAHGGEELGVVRPGARQAFPDAGRPAIGLACELPLDALHGGEEPARSRPGPGHRRPRRRRRRSSCRRPSACVHPEEGGPYRHRGCAGTPLPASACPWRHRRDGSGRSTGPVRPLRPDSAGSAETGLRPRLRSPRPPPSRAQSSWHVSTPHGL